MRFPTTTTKAVLLSLACTAMVAGCAKVPPASDPDALAEYQQTNDPLEPTNRFFYSVNDAIDRYSLKPIAQAYVYVTPLPVRTGMHNFLSNLGSPVLFANDVGEARPRHAGTTFMRFMINSTVGVLGIFDVAKSVGYSAHDTDFGVTMGLWGVPSGPFLYLPIIGPSSPRGVTGFAMDQALDPFNYVPRGYGLLTFNWARFGMTAIDTRASLLTDVDKIKASALDPYATFRSLYRQHVHSQIEALRNDTQTTVPDWYTQ
ncbi:MAG TPA: MlaA family lipoprotein [Acetobacteraceae bacterium]|nr:MlaA family lipoprotein [Acetobacteraceae bacterium]